jgi:hypothetical protein
MPEMRNTYTVLVGKPEAKNVAMQMLSQMDQIKINVREIYDMRKQTEFTCFRVGTNGGLNLRMSYRAENGLATCGNASQKSLPSDCP